MAQNYKKKQPTGREYVDATKEFCSTTHYRCEMLPKRWAETLLLPLVRCADEIETDVCRANRIYLNPQNMVPEDLIQAYKERIRLLTEAVTLFADFDVKFDRLMGRVDIAGSEKKRLKSLFYEMLAKERMQNPELREMDIRMIARADEMEYESLSGSQCLKLKLTSQNRDHWLDTEHTALHHIRNRINADKKAVSGLKMSVSGAVD